jgi:hypothetical protein
MTDTRLAQLSLRLAALTGALLLSCGAARAAPSAGWIVNELPDRLEISIGGETFASYVFKDPDISRPYFAQVRAEGGAQATRNQPPREGVDLMDHPTFHPGIWLAFGDLGGADDWRLLAPVEHVEFVQRPTGGVEGVSFAVRNRYGAQPPADGVVCEEIFRCRVVGLTAGRLIVWDSTFTGEQEFAFGDQEEMGLGFRIATPLRAQRAEDSGIPAGNGTILDAEGRENEAGVWGHSANWCDYSGVVDGQRVGMTIFCHPQNFRPSWFHARDRGLLVANPFGRAAFDQGEPSRVVVKPGESLRLRYGVLVHAGPKDEPVDLEAAYNDYVALTREN